MKKGRQKEYLSQTDGEGFAKDDCKFSKMRYEVPHSLPVLQPCSGDVER